MLRSTLLRRAIHTAPKLPNQQLLAAQGIPQVYSAQGFKTAWVDQQDFLATRLTTLTAGTENETRLPFHIVLNTAKKPFLTNVFNAASQTHNNHLFFEQLIQSSQATQPSRLLLKKIEQSFGSLDGLKQTLAGLADDGLAGQGWLFVVEDAHKELKVLVANNSGTPYFYGRNQSIDLNSGKPSQEQTEALETAKQNMVDGHKDWTMPLIAINLWDHAYLHDYGVAGKAKFVENVFDHLNWDVINNRLFTGV